MARPPVLAALAALALTLPLAVAAQSTDALESAAQQAAQGKDYGRAAQLLRQAFEMDRTNPGLLAGAAGYDALGGNGDKALAGLRQAIDAGYLDADGTAADNAFAALRGDARFGALLAQLRQRQQIESKLYDSDALASPYTENLSEDEKVAGLSKFWSEVKYNFVYVDTLKAIDWDRLYLEYLPKVRATRSTAEYYKVLMALCARLQDGHTNVYPGPQLRNTMMAKPLLSTHLVEGRVLVRKVFDPALQARGIVPGTEVLEVDGQPVTEYAMRELAPYASASTPQDLERRIYTYSFLSGPVDVAPRVRFRTAAGKNFETTLRRLTLETYDKAVPDTPPFVFKTLPGNVAYVALNSFGDDRAADAFLAAFDRIAASSALVIDLRNNSGGSSNVGYRVLATLAGQPFQTSRWETRDYRPSYRAWQHTMPNYGEPAPAWPNDAAHAYRKPVAVLISSATYSAAEDFSVAFDAMGRGIIAGEATGGSTGMPLFLRLPGGGIARICTKADTYPDGRKWVGKGIQPSLKVAPTVLDVQADRDTVLEAAVAALKKQI
ncbi:S41 family peptidase [Herbaspirillum sp. SJZ107]|uniref:S41 family peptidase n=1 Tax=Herbaspirillum sp. SJZ107 TaxID=2572881 RepID=UPI00116FE2AB|nr:S41 family peptidase [Herbaspirillum sp. SJZ107]TQK06870.1 C-terminal processing protease CtpA/Prc [Herbaspirillum sp. SJZ107]